MTNVPNHGTDKLAPKQAAEIIGVSTKTLCIWRQQEIGPPWRQRETRRIYYLRGDIDAWEAQHRTGVMANERQPRSG